MRCYFFRNNRIESVEILKPGSDDEPINQDTDLWSRRNGDHFDGIEMWAGRRLIYRNDPGKPPASN